MLLHQCLLGFFEVCLVVADAGLLFVAAGFLALIGIKIYDVFGPPHWRNHLPRAFLREADMPHVLVQVPLYNEHEIGIGAMYSVASLDWPRDRLHIQMLDDSTDESSEMITRAAADLRARGFLVEHRRRTDRSGFKAGALAEGLAATSAPLIAMLDVDFRPPAHWLRDIVPILLADPDAGFVQSRCEFANYDTNWLTRVQGMMLDAHFVIEQFCRYRAGWLFQFNGTGGIRRRSAIMEAGGWSSDSLVEDLDLTIRVALAGWRGLFVMEPAVPGLVPERIGHWRVQQRRWSTGFVQVARKLLAAIWTAPWSVSFKLSASFLIFVQMFFPCLALGVVSFVACLALRGGNIVPYLPMLVFFFSLTLAISVGLTLLPYVTLKRGPLWRYLVTLAMLPPSMIFISLANAPSIVSTVVGRRESFKRTPKSMKALKEVSARD